MPSRWQQIKWVGLKNPGQVSREEVDVQLNKIQDISSGKDDLRECVCAVRARVCVFVWEIVKGRECEQGVLAWMWVRERVDLKSWERKIDRFCVS